MRRKRSKEREHQEEGIDLIWKTWFNVPGLGHTLPSVLHPEVTEQFKFLEEVTFSENLYLPHFHDCTHA